MQRKLRSTSIKSQCFKILSACVIAASILSCATITRGTKDVLVVESEPAGAKVTTSTGLVSSTPATFKVARRGGFTVTIEKEGYESITVQVSSRVAGAGAAGMAGNIVLGGLIGAAVDAGTGATLELQPNPIIVKLVPIGGAIQETDKSEGYENDIQNNFDPDKNDASEEISLSVLNCPWSIDHVLVTIDNVG